jgi:hypothetical protein
MNNNFYQWHDERMVGFEMQEINRAVEQDRLLKEAGLYKQNLLLRAVEALRNLLITRKKPSQSQSSMEQRPYQSPSKRAAS